MSVGTFLEIVVIGAGAYVAIVAAIAVFAALIVWRTRP